MREWLAYRAGATPGATAVVEPADGSTVTYAALDEAVEECAARLSSLGVGVDDTVGMLLPGGSAAVCLVHATMRLGATLVPFSTSLTADELAPRVALAAPDLLVCSDGTAERAAELSVGTLSVDDTGIPAERPEPFDLPEWELDDPLVRLFTSGTTGEPKLVELTVMNVLASACASAFRLGVLPDDVWCSPLSPASMGGLAPVYRSVLYGAAVAPAPTDADALLAAMHRHEPTGVSLVPVLLDRLLDAGELPDSLRFVLLGGAPARPALLDRCVERGVPVCPTYGMTETASQIATVRPDEDPAGTVGHPLLFTTVTVVDNHGAPVGPGERGELVVDGPTVTPGYHDDPAATERAFCSHGFRTGDIGRFDPDGRLRVENRKDDRINTGGNTVDPGEVADVLRALPGVADATVVGLPDERWGELVGALVEPEAGETVEPTAVERHCRDRLADYKLPRLLAVGTLPRTGSGTVDRPAVRALLDRRGERIDE